MAGLFVAFSFCPVAQAKDAEGVSSDAKLKKHFDRDKDGRLNQIELMNLRTHRIFHYPLVEKREQEPYDVNGDSMMEPFEMRQYLADKASGHLKAVYKDYVEKKKLAERRRKERFQKIAEENLKIQMSR